VDLPHLNRGLISFSIIYKKLLCRGGPNVIFHSAKHSNFSLENSGIVESHAVSIVKFIYDWNIQQYRCKRIKYRNLDSCSCVYDKISFPTPVTDRQRHKHV